MILLHPDEAVSHAICDPYEVTVMLGSPDPDLVRNRVTGEIVKRDEAVRRGWIVAPIVLVRP